MSSVIRRVIKVGSMLGLTIPRSLEKAIKWKEGDYILLRVEGNTLVIKKIVLEELEKNLIMEVKDV